jgi:hypothetical protein
MRRAAWTLIFLAPVVAELMLGNVPLKMAWVFLFFIPIYGCGALFIREVVRRTGGGWVAVLLMGLAYGLFEEGLALQSLTSPHMYGAADWAPRLLGFNTAYSELNLVYHPVFSITIPIIVVELMFGREPYLRRGGLIWTGIVALLGAALLRVAVVPSQDPGYTQPLLPTLIIAALIVVLVVVALRLRPSTHSVPVTHPLLLTAVFAVASFLFLGLIWPFGDATQPSFTHGLWVLVPMAVGALIVISVAVWLWHHPLDRLGLVAAATGALVGHTVFGLVANASTWPDRIFLGVLAAATLALGIRAIRSDQRVQGLRGVDLAG